MKDKKELLYRNCIITCWVMLIVCVLLKLFGIPWFNYNTHIDWLNIIDDCIMNNFALMVMYSYLSLFINGYAMCLIVTKENKISKYFIPLSVVCVLSIFIKYINANMGMLFDTLGLYIVCYSITKKKNFKNYLIMIVLSFVYQFLSLFIRSINQVVFYNTITSNLLMLDYYIMLVLTYLYLKRGGNDLCSVFHFRSKTEEGLSQVSCCSQQKTLCKKHTQNLKQHSIVNREV